MISILCPTYNEEKYIVKCIESIISQDYPLEEMELLFIDGGSNDKTREIIAKYQEEYDFIKLLDNPFKIVPYAMNIGIEHAMGNIIVRIDAHSFFPNNYVSVLSNNLLKLDVDNVGVICKTDVFHKSTKTLAIREVLSNPLGVGNALFRIGINKPTDVDTVPFGCYKREVFEKYGLYDVRLVRNQDIELNKRIKRSGGKIRLIPDTYCVYYARETWNTIMKNNFQNGKWNILTVYYTKNIDSLSIRHFIPMFFVLSILFPVIISLFYLPIGLLSVMSLAIYLALIAFFSIQIAWRKKLNFYYLFATFIILHISYGLGSLKGLFDITFRIK